jgi:hypothetical protein
MKSRRNIVFSGFRIVWLFGERKFADLDVSEGDRKAVVLKQAMALRQLSEVWDRVEFGSGHDLAEFRCETLELDQFLAVEPVFDMRSANDDVGRIPLAGQFIGGGGDEIVERPFAAVSVLPALASGWTASSRI